MRFWCAFGFHSWYRFEYRSNGVPKGEWRCRDCFCGWHKGF